MIMDNNITLRLATETFEVKTISAAWNKVRELRNTMGAELEGKVLEVVLPETLTTDRIPNNILFKANKNGKIEFKDLAKVKRSEERKAASKKVNKKAADEDYKEYLSKGEEFVNNDIIWVGLWKIKNRERSRFTFWYYMLYYNI